MTLLVLQEHLCLLKTHVMGRQCAICGCAPGLLKLFL